MTMKQFLLGCLRWPWRMLNGLRVALANLLLLALLGLGLMQLASHEEEASIPDEAVLHVVLGSALVEQASYEDPVLALVDMPDAAAGETVLHELTATLRWAAEDARIQSVVLVTDALAGTDLAKLAEVTGAIEAFRATGKQVIVFGDNFSQAQYFIASAADRVYLNPMGSVQLQGLAAYQAYARELLDRLAIHVHIFRAGEFKSFIEPFVRNDMSPEARANLQQWLDEQWAFYTRTVEQRRKLDGNAIAHYIGTQDALLAAHDNDPARLALAYGLVDELATRNQADRIIDSLSPAGAAARVDAATYYAHESRRRAAAELLDGLPRIRIIHASGPIVDGEQPPGYAGAETLIQQIRDARSDEDVAALVLRIDSPGGSAFAAELIREELSHAQADGKPVVASMGGVAASGGYWIAASADEIWASPATITGSIGVFGVFPTFEESLARLGIHSDGYATTPLADALQVDRPMNPLAARVLQRGVDFTYQRFLQLVATGRKSKPSLIDQVAQGRVWTGAHARSLNLVDHLGDLEEAVGAAARLARVDRYTTEVVEPPLSPMDSLMQVFNSRQGHWQGWLAASGWGEVLRLLTGTVQAGRPFNDPNHIYATCWECRYRLD